MSTIADFRELSREEQMVAVAKVIVSQNPRLLRGDDMEGPHQQFVEGKHFVLRPMSADIFGVDVPNIAAQQLHFTYEQLERGHPFFDINVAQCNYLHMLSVNVVSPFHHYEVGDTMNATVLGVTVPVVLTQEMVDAHSTIVARFGLSV